MIPWRVVVIVVSLTIAVDVTQCHLCIQEPRQRLNVTGYNDLYSDCYYMNGPCGDNFDNAPPYQSIVRSGSNMTVKLHTPLPHITTGKRGYFQFNLKALGSDKFTEIARVPDAAGYYHDVPVQFPDIEGQYILQVVSVPYRYYKFYSCSDLVFVTDGPPAPAAVGIGESYGTQKTSTSATSGQKWVKDSSTQHRSGPVASILVTLVACIQLHL